MSKELNPEKRRKAKSEELTRKPNLQKELIPKEKHKSHFWGIYAKDDMDIFPGYFKNRLNPLLSVKTLEDLIEQDNIREKDGFPRRIRIGRLMRPDKGNKSKIVIIPSTSEPKFYHDDSTTQDDDETGGTGKEQEGEVIGEQPAQPQQGQGEGTGAGQGDESDHDVSQEAFDIGKVLTLKFKLPNIKDKGRKPSLTKFTYELTDRNRRFGQILEKKATLKKILETNFILGRANPDNIDPKELIINPDDQIYRILSREKDFENQAVVFFIRDYSGSMQGKPTEVISTQHMFIYSWLMYQYQNNVKPRFILHDTQAKEVPDFYTYYHSQVAGGTRISPAYNMVYDIIVKERLATENNIYIFQGTDGDDWDEDGTELVTQLKQLLTYCNRIGITVAKNSWGGTGITIVEKNIEDSGLLKSKDSLLRLDAMMAEEATEERIIEGLKHLIS
jgi:uncharacterized sporulation protein YeaH/YhbH (DUF444 family)